MTEIYDEVGYIKEVLEHGLSQRWQRDAMLLSRFYKLNGKKKSEAKEIIKSKCEKYVIGFNRDIQFNEVNSIAEKAWKNDKELREIRNVEISKEVLDWFLNLENFELDDETFKYVEDRRKKYHIKIDKKIYNFNRIKLLFTLYIWYKIQCNYTEDNYAKIFPLNRNQGRIKQDASLKTSFKMMPELYLLYDLGDVGITSNRVKKNGTIAERKLIAKFIENNKIFLTPITNKNKIVIDGDDLYNCGYWLEKQKFGTFICQHCGKEFAHYSNSKNESKRKYCKRCSDIIRHNKFDGDLKIITCQDCGKDVEVEKTDAKTTRCFECQDKKNNEIKLKWWNENKEKYR